MEDTTALHPWEERGFGKFPYRLVRTQHVAIEVRRGEEERAGSCCDVCGNSISDVFFIRSADGKEFKVGSDCVEKAAKGWSSPDNQSRIANRRFRDSVKMMKAKAAKARKELREAGRAEAAWAAFDADSSRADALPHPAAHMAASGRTLADWIRWTRKNGTASGLRRAWTTLEDLYGTK